MRKLSLVCLCVMMSSAAHADIDDDIRADDLEFQMQANEQKAWMRHQELMFQLDMLRDDLRRQRETLDRQQPRE